MKNMIKILAIVLLGCAVVRAEPVADTDTQNAEQELAELLKELEQAEPKDGEETVSPESKDEKIESTEMEKDPEKIVEASSATTSKNNEAVE